MYPQSMFGAKIRKISNPKFSIENFQVLELKKSLYIAWTCFRNAIKKDYMYISESDFFISNDFYSCDSAHIRLKKLLPFY